MMEDDLQVLEEQIQQASVALRNYYKRVPPRARGRFVQETIVRLLWLHTNTSKQCYQSKNLPEEWEFRSGMGSGGRNENQG